MLEVSIGRAQLALVLNGEGSQVSIGCEIARSAEPFQIVE
jgi:hypothetical protein